MIWQKPAGDDDPLSKLIIPDNMEEIAQKAREQSRVELAERIKRFQVKVTWKILNQPIW
jgi:hypothetical protein